MKVRLAFLYVISTFLIIIIVVLALVKGKKEEIKIEKEEEEEIDFESKENIQLYMSKNDQITEVNLNYYLLCVVASEMPFKYEYEALKAQAIVARTYLYNKIINNLEENGDVCDDYRHCQAFNTIDKLEEIWIKKGFSNEEIKAGEDKIKKAIVATENKIITYNGKIINALFHASSPQRTEDAKAIWSGEDVPYLKSVDNVESLDYQNRNSEVNVSYSTFKNTLIDNGYIDDLDKDTFLSTSIGEYTESGRVKTLKIGSYYIKAENLRTLFGLNSTNFTFDIDENGITFKVLGFGHGVGMSQVGADTYAKEGMTCDQIIHHYYTGVEIADVEEIQKRREEK